MRVPASSRVNVHRSAAGTSRSGVGSSCHASGDGTVRHSGWKPVTAGSTSAASRRGTSCHAPMREASCGSRDSARSLPAPTSTSVIRVPGWSHRLCRYSRHGAGRRCASSTTSTRASPKASATAASASADVCGKRPGSARASNTARLMPATDERTGTGTHVTFQPRGTSPSAIRTAAVLPRPGSPNTHTAPWVAIACPTASATARTDDVRTICAPAGNATPASAPLSPTGKPLVASGPRRGGADVFTAPPPCGPARARSARACRVCCSSRSRRTTARSGRTLPA
jgi:hypothetical protein